MAYHDNEELPSSWERDELLGTDEEDQSDLEEVISILWAISGHLDLFGRVMHNCNVLSLTLFI